MAVLTGTVLDVHSFSTPAGPQWTNDTTPQQLESCIVDATLTGTYVQGTGSGGFSIAAVDAAIAAARRDGRTYTIISAAFVAMGDLNGTLIGSKTVSTTSSTVAGLLTTGDCSTEWGAALLSTVWNAGVKFRVTYKAI